MAKNMFMKNRAGTAYLDTLPTKPKIINMHRSKRKQDIFMIIIFFLPYLSIKNPLIN